jgi:5-methylcytosine-specific restriction endonuclease McrA
MIRLRLPFGQGDLIDECQTLLEGFIRRRRGQARTQLDAVVDQLSARCSKYIQEHGDPTRIGGGPWHRGDGAVGDLLYNSYQSGKGADKSIVTEARKIATGYCPYCGLRLRLRPAGAEHESDHHLPRTRFPEFSVHLPNLVTACHDCNFRKSDKVSNENGERLFLHPYFDDCLAQRLLEAEVLDSGGGVPGVEFRLRPSVGALPEGNVVKNHVDWLDLPNRLEDEVVGELCRILEMLAAGDCAIDEVRTELDRIAHNALSDRPNDPHGLVFLAASRSAALEAILSEIRRKRRALEGRATAAGPLA